ncbi:MAG: DUF5060 domain-containing protein [Chthonomonadales bacterium]
MLRMAIAGIGCALLVMGCAALGSADPVRKVGRWALWEAEFHARSVPRNPFTGVTLQAEFRSPSGRRYATEGFYDGGDVWRIRFMPDEVGTWHWSVRSVPADAGLTGMGIFQCVNSRIPGPLRVGQNPLWFATASGTPVYLTAFLLWRVDRLDVPTLSRTLDFLHRNGFNAIVGPHLTKDDAAWMPMPNGRMDFTRFNFDVWRRLDRVLEQAGARGMYVIPFSILGGTNDLPGPPKDDQRELLLHYWVARWGGYWNATFQPVSEYEEGYSSAQMQSLGRRLYELDHGRHLISVHCLRAGDASLWHASWFGYVTVQDKLSDLDWAKYVWLADLFKQAGKPILCHECFWEGNYYQREAGLDAANMRRGMWMAALSGGQITYADEVVPPRRWQRREDVGVTFSERGMAVKPLGRLYQTMSILARFFRSIPWWRLQPMPRTAPGCACLADPGRTYVIYLPEGQARLVLDGMRSAARGRWFDPRTGRYGPRVSLPAGHDVQVTAPSPGDWVLTLGMEAP